ncbi:4-hydroxy-tetrahydrodipicolinate reductase [Azorhizobium doebereinerae]|uniref:4-hydroxy-tetrahydrodipicolinate reductase n=1 Tax=Azorhizobium doebereinerae TaxID=281091 RepID=UPI0003FAC9D0|nr:4-hydroxy-tetrahydrodipicolinate reductase [Azorhizobium doebereinerae]
MSDLRVVINGAGGRMGQELLRAVIKGDGFALVGALEHSASSHLGEDAGVLAGLKPTGITVESDAAGTLNGTDAVVDFSSPAASVRLAERLAEAGIPVVIGTTGFSAAENAAIEAAARRTAVVKSGNMSLGVNVLAALTRRAAAALGLEFDIEIVEMHHARKVDAPSGTALLLGEAAAAGRGVSLADWTVKARDGHTGARRPGDIGFASLRGGSVVGEHAVIFAGPSERIELVHKAEDRSIFANGALAAAKWAKGREPGLYSMADVLGITD